MGHIYRRYVMINYDTLYDVYEQYMRLRKQYNMIELHTNNGLIIERNSHEWGA